MLLYGATDLMTSVGLNALEANFGAQVTWRTADVRTDMPSAWQTPFPATAGAAFATNDSVNPKRFDVSTAAGTAMWVQAAAIAVLTTGTTVKEGLVKLWSSVNSMGFLVAKRRIEILPGLGTDAAIVPVGDPFSCVGVNGLMFAISFYGVNGTVTPTPCWRAFDGGDIQRPAAWSSLTTMAAVTANKFVNSGNQTIVTTDKMMAQAGLQFTTSGTSPRIIADVVVAAREA